MYNPDRVAMLVTFEPIKVLSFLFLFFFIKYWETKNCLQHWCLKYFWNSMTYQVGYTHCIAIFSKKKWGFQETLNNFKIRCIKKPTIWYLSIKVFHSQCCVASPTCRCCSEPASPADPREVYWGWRNCQSPLVPPAQNTMLSRFLGLCLFFLFIQMWYSMDSFGY